jgi:hypothetical protein
LEHGVRVSPRVARRVGLNAKCMLGRFLERAWWLPDWVMQVVAEAVPSELRHARRCRSSTFLRIERRGFLMYSRSHKSRQAERDWCKCCNHACSCTGYLLSRTANVAIHLRIRLFQESYYPVKSLSSLKSYDSYFLDFPKILHRPRKPSFAAEASGSMTACMDSYISSHRVATEVRI